MYRETIRYRNQRAYLARKYYKREESETDLYTLNLPDLRMRITVERFDFGYDKQVMELHKSSRIDCYDAYTNGVLWKEKIGISRVLEGIRKANPRIISERNLF